jgi:Lrp/AsnC family leucine-responsive transcriptional regulator
MGLRNGSTNRDLDDTDLKILQCLSQNAKASFAELGERVHLTAAAVHGRVKKLERSGVIKNYGIELNYDAIGLPVTAFVRVQTGTKSCRESGQSVLGFEEITECHSVAGEDDLILKIRVATPLDLQILLDDLKKKGIIMNSNSLFVLETHFERNHIPTE